MPEPDPLVDAIFERRIRELLIDAGPRAFSLEVQREVDDLLAHDAEPLRPSYRQRLLATAERALRERREATQPRFHAKDGWWFWRQVDGSVVIAHSDDPRAVPEVMVTLDAGTWASIVCSVSENGEDGERWNAARRFHGDPSQEAANG